MALGAVKLAVCPKSPRDSVIGRIPIGYQIQVRKTLTCVHAAVSGTSGGLIIYW